MKTNRIIAWVFVLCISATSVVHAQNSSLAEADTLVAHAEKLSMKGNIDESMSMLRRAKLVYESMGQVEGANYGKCIHQISYNYFMLDSLDLGLEYAMQAAEIRKQALGEINDDYLMTMNNIATYYFMTNQLEKSEVVYRTILSKCLLRDRVPNRYSFFSTNAARVLFKQGKNGQAEQLLDSTLVLVQRDFGDDGKVLGDAAHDCANVYVAFDNYCKAAEFMEEALKAYEKFSEDYGKMLEKLGIIYISREMCYDIDKAMRIMNLTNEFNEDKLKKPCEDITCLTELAEYYASIDSVEEAKNTFMKALKTEGSLQEQRDLKTKYASFLSNQKMYHDAAFYYRLAAADEKQLNGVSELYASTMYMAGLLYNISQKRTDAVECLTQSAETYAKLGGEKNLMKSYKSLQSVGTAYSIERNFEEALKYYTLAMNGLYRWPQSEDYASALTDVAKTECNLGSFDSSLEHYRMALQIFDSLQMINEYTNTLQMIQYTLRKAGRDEEADMMEESVGGSVTRQAEKLLAEEKENLPMYLSIWGEDGYQYALALGTIAELEYSLQNYREGTAHYTSYLSALRSSFQQLFTVMNATERSALWEASKNTLTQLITNVYDYPETDAEPDLEMCRLAYDAALLSKGILLNSSIEFMRVLEESGDKHLTDLFSQIEHNTEEILTMQAAATGGSADPQLMARIKEKKEENARLEQELRDKCPELKQYSSYLAYTWEDVQKALGTHDIAIELVDVGDGVSYDHYIVALVLTPDCVAPVAIPLCQRLMLQKWLRTPSGRVYDQNDTGLEFWSALLPLFEGKERIYFSPEAEIHQLAVEYLKVDGVPLFDKYPLYRVSSTKEICKTSTKHKKQNFALFGDIEYSYGVEIAVTNRGDENLGRLPNTKEEIDNISALYRKKAKLDIYTETRASEESFRKLSGKGVTMLHIASHGLYTAPRRASEQEAMRGSLLAFCGYNVIGADSINDGKVSAEDVARMNLRDCEMVVLSACKTGLGEKGLDGIFGLQRGFKNAGVGTIVMSLRNVHDEATAQLMTVFYSELASGTSKREALKKAMAEIRSIDKFKKAEYWASFIMLDGLD